MSVSKALKQLEINLRTSATSQAHKLAWRGVGLMCSGRYLSLFSKQSKATCRAAVPSRYLVNVLDNPPSVASAISFLLSFASCDCCTAISLLIFLRLSFLNKNDLKAETAIARYPSPILASGT